MHQQKYGIRQRQHLMGMLLGIVILWHWGTGESAACILTSISCNSPCTATADGCTCPADTEVSFTAHLSVACEIDDTIWRVTDLDSGQVNEYSYNLWQPGFTYTFSEAGAYTVKAIVYPTSNPPSSKLITVTVPETSFTVNVIPSASGTIYAKDSEADDVPETHGISCSSDAEVGDPECQEAYPREHVVALKAKLDPGWLFLGWKINGERISSKNTVLVSAMERSSFEKVASVVPIDEDSRIELDAVHVEIGRLDFRPGNCDGLPPGAERDVEVSISPELPPGHFIEFRVDDLGNPETYGSAYVSKNSRRTESGTITIAGDMQTAIGGGAWLRIVAMLDGDEFSSKAWSKQPFAVFALPTNFRQTIGEDAGQGILHFEYLWDSDSGDLSDLEGVYLGEFVEWPENIPNPPFRWHTIANPTYGYVNAVLGKVQDYHVNNPADDWCMDSGPNAIISSTQYYRYRSLRCMPSEASPYEDELSWGVVIDGPYVIERKIDTDGISWFYQITKAGILARREPLPVCGP